MIAGPAGVHICDSCVSVCKTIIDRELAGAAEPESAPQAQEPSVGRFNLVKPAQIKAHMDDHIISQDYAKRALAVAVYNHYKRLRAEERIEASEEFADLDPEYPTYRLRKATSFARTHRKR